MRGSLMEFRDAEQRMEALGADEYGEGDLELTHIEADKILCEVLTKLGYVRLVDLFRKVPKWYA